MENKNIEILKLYEEKIKKLEGVEKIVKIIEFGNKIDKELSALEKEELMKKLMDSMDYEDIEKIKTLIEAREGI